MHSKPMTEHSGEIQKILFGLGLAYLIFLDYGSLIPLEFVAHDISDTWQFLWTQWEPSGYISLTDQITNVLLSVPLAFFGFGFIARPGKYFWNSCTALLVIVFCMADAALIEFLQCFLPTRTPAFRDIFAQGLGAAIGIVFWLVAGDGFSRFVLSLTIKQHRIRNVSRISQNSIAAYSFLYFAMLLAINGYFSNRWVTATDAMQKLADIHPAPFYGHYFASTAWATSSVLQYFAMYVPAGILYWLWQSSRKSDMRTFKHWFAMLAGASTAFVVETGKLFIQGKYPDTTNILLAAFAGSGAFTVCSCSPWLAADGQYSAESKDATPAANVYSPLIVFRRLAALILFAVVGFSLLHFPVASFWLSGAIAIYVAVLLRNTAIWLLVIPAILPILDFAPWTGRFFWNEFDLFVTSTIAVSLWVVPRPSSQLRIPKRAVTALLLFGLSTLISLTIGLFPLADADFNAFSNYYSRYNSLLAGKGFLEVTALLPLLIYNIRSGNNVLRYLCYGMVTGLSGMVMAGVWERAVFPGLFDFSSSFRISALFSSMHTGDSPVEAYLVSALPFLAAWVFFRKSKVTVALAISIFVLGVYGLFVTFARGGYGAFIVSLLILMIGCLHAAKHHAFRRSGFWGGAALVVMCVGLVAVPVMQGSFAKSRFALIDQDMSIRLNHWRNALNIMEPDWTAQVFGMGLGRFPETYYFRNPTGVFSATYQFQKNSDNTYLSLGSGEVIYLEQIVSVKPNEAYRLSFDVKSADASTGFNVMVCERTFFQSYNCRDFGASNINTGAQWRHYQTTIDSGVLGSAPWFARRTTKLILENTAPNSVLQIDNIHLVDSKGLDLVSNGDFSKGADYWYFSAFNHLAWHVKNIFVQLVFEQGWLGLAAFSLLVTIALFRILKEALQGKIVAVAMLSAIVGFLSVGLFGSPLDAPRLAFLFYLMLSSAYLSSLSKAALASNEPIRSQLPIGRHEEALIEQARETKEDAASGAHGLVSKSVKDVSVKKPMGPEGGLKSSSIRTGRINIKALMPLVAGIVVMSVAVGSVLNFPAMPYNIRELMHDTHPLLGVIALSSMVFWIFGFPLVIAYWLSSQWCRFWHYPVLLMCHGVGAWIFISVSVPLESIHDIVGSPILNWGWHWEIAGRFVALFSAYSLTSTAIALIIMAYAYTRKVVAGFLQWVLTAFLVYPTSYWVVVTKAATDNIIELMAGSGTVASACWLTLFLALLTGCGSLLAARINLRRSLNPVLLVGLLISFPLGYFLVSQGTENMILKNDRLFSALQFLLSTDRQHYIQGHELMVRYFIFHAVIIGVIMSVQMVFLNVLQLQKNLKR
jgi:VanZ family protein